MFLSPNDTESYTRENTGRITPLGLFFSDNQPTGNESRLNLKFSSDLFSDSLFLKQPQTMQPVLDELSEAHIYFPDAETTPTDTISWSVPDQHFHSFDEYCLALGDDTDAATVESIILKICSMVHHIHNNNAADYPILSDMIRFTSQGEPIILLMPELNPGPISTKFKGNLFASNVGAPEIQEHTCMNPQAFAYNVGILAARLLGYSPSEELNQVQSLQALTAWLKNTSGNAHIAKLQRIILQTLQDDPQERPYCPMKIYKAITGVQPFDCQE